MTKRDEQTRIKEAALSANELRSLLNYNPYNGMFTARESRGSWKEGKVVGRIQKNGYRYIKVNGYFYVAQRLAWLYNTGEWPGEGIFVSHIDQDKANNRWNNLRTGTHAECVRNRKKRITDKSKLHSYHTGVSWTEKVKKWSATIVYRPSDGSSVKRICIALFDTEYDAVCMRRLAEGYLYGEYAPKRRPIRIDRAKYRDILVRKIFPLIQQEKGD